MGVELQIDSEEAARLASELASLTGQSVSDAVVAALRESVARRLAVRQKSDKLMAIAADIKRHLSEPLPSSDHAVLYGDGGLPHPSGSRFDLTDIEPALKP